MLENYLVFVISLGFVLHCLLNYLYGVETYKYMYAWLIINRFVGSDDLIIWYQSKVMT